MLLSAADPEWGPGREPRTRTGDLQLWLWSQTGLNTLEDEGRVPQLLRVSGRRNKGSTFLLGLPVPEGLQNSVCHSGKHPAQF